LEQFDFETLPPALSGKTSSARARGEHALIRILHQNRVHAVLMYRLRRELGPRLASRNASHFGAASCRGFQFHIKHKYMFDLELE
jgi:hypothetical protein